VRHANAFHGDDGELMGKSNFQKISK
jgi:hypothetical protein